MRKISKRFKGESAPRSGPEGRTQAEIAIRAVATTAEMLAPLGSFRFMEHLTGNRLVALNRQLAQVQQALGEAQVNIARLLEIRLIQSFSKEKK